MGSPWEGEAPAEPLFFGVLLVVSAQRALRPPEGVVGWVSPSWCSVVPGVMAGLCCRAGARWSRGEPWSVISYQASLRRESAGVGILACKISARVL